MVHAGLRAAKGFPTKEGPHVKGKHRSVQLPSGPAVAALSVLLFWAVCAFLGTRDAGSELGRTWKRFRIAWVQPVVHPMLVLLMGMSLVSCFDKMLLTLGSIYMWCRNSTAVATPGGRSRSAAAFTPKVLVQIPLRNETTCFKRGIAAACGLDWPAEKLVIQIIDDSDEEALLQLVKSEVDTWRALGAPIWHLRRPSHRIGQKAGALDHGLRHPSQKGCEFVAILDVDFVPASDFLHKTVQHFEGHPRRGMVQARWDFINQTQNLLTRFQVIDLSFHHKVEQPVQSYFTKFFSFNGTAAVWRMETVRDAGGWLHRTTTEDMDVSVRAHMIGYEFLYVDVPVPSELPVTYQGLCKQRFRWAAGPARLFMHTWRDILTTPKFSPWWKFHLLAVFFGIRRCLYVLPNMLLFGVVIPAAVLVPAGTIPLWAVSFSVPLLLLHAIPLMWNCDRGNWLFIVPFLLFENVLGLTRARAILSGLLNLKGASVWVVTPKTGVSQSDQIGGADAGAEGAQLNSPCRDERNGCTNGADSKITHRRQRLSRAHDELVIKHDSKGSAEQNNQAPFRDRNGGAPSATTTTPPAKRTQQATADGTQRLFSTGALEGTGCSVRGGWESSLPGTPRKGGGLSEQILATQSRGSPGQRGRMRAGFRSFWTRRNVHGAELVMAAWGLGAACAGLVAGDTRFLLILCLQGAASLAVGLDLLV